MSEEATRQVYTEQTGLTVCCREQLVKHKHELGSDYGQEKSREQQPVLDQLSSAESSTAVLISLLLPQVDNP